MEHIQLDVACSLVDQDTKTYSIMMSGNNTVAALIRKVCTENSIPIKTNYMLIDDKERVLPWSMTLASCGIINGAVLCLTNEDVHDQQRMCRCSNWWLVAAISFIIGTVGITAIAVLFTKNGTPTYKYGVVMDAGSSHTKLFVYRWDGQKLQDTAVAGQIHSCSVKGGGLTSYVSSPENLTGPLSACLDEAKYTVQSDMLKETPIFLGATAGMRMLNEVNKSQCDAILAQVRNFITEKYSFQFPVPTEQARIISGQEEGTFGWITANYMSGKLGVMPKFNGLSSSVLKREVDTVGVLDMGGASTQITFFTPKNIQPEYREDLVLYGNNYSVYTHSYLCYGINEAIRRYQAILVQSQGYNLTNITSPCSPNGSIEVATYSDIFEAPCANRFTGHLSELISPSFFEKDQNFTFIGSGDEETCNLTVRSLFNFNASCLNPPCTFNGTFQPELQGKFYAFSSFFYTMDFLNLTKKHQFTLDEFALKLSNFCKTPWEEVSVMPTTDNGMFLPWYCFEGHFIRTLLVDGYKFDNNTWTNIQFLNQINNTDLGWTLGYMLNSSNAIQVAEHSEYISKTAFSALTVLFIVFILLSLLLGCYAKKHPEVKWQYESVPTYGTF